jgi:HSP20 family protein
MANIIKRREETAPARRWPGWEPGELFEEMLGYDPFRAMRMARIPGEEMFVPRFEVKERADAFVFKADLPGVKEEDLDITLSGNMLTVSGRRKREKTEGEEGDRWYVREVSYGEFSRSFTLPDGCDVDNVKAELKDGELTLIVPKRPETQPKKIALGKGEAKGAGKKAEAAKA